jgi:hypothetical protein
MRQKQQMKRLLYAKRAIPHQILVRTCDGLQRLARGGKWERNSLGKWRGILRECHINDVKKLMKMRTTKV